MPKDKKRHKKVDMHEYLEYYSRRIMLIAIPVVLTLVLDAFIVRFIEETSGSADLGRNFAETMSHNDGGLTTTWAIYMALIMIGAILVVTIILLALYYYGCMKIIYGWLIIAVSLLCSYYVYTCFYNVPIILNIALDWITLAIFFLNLAVVGNMSVFWRAPRIITQIFMVFISILIALVFLSLPDWTVWILLGLLVIYDACVVLCPHGLLKMLIKKSEERGDAIPALIYSTAVYTTKIGYGNEEEDKEEYREIPADDEDLEDDEGSGSGSSSGASNELAEDDPLLDNKPQTTQPLLPRREEDTLSVEVEGEKPKKKKKHHKDDDDDDQGIRLGLGDFCFYGILITRAARLGWDLVILCVFAVILGLSLTLLILAWLERPLPALPLSLILGILFFIIGAMTFRPFDDVLRLSSITF